jgi:hypothetical protein
VTVRDEAQARALFQERYRNTPSLPASRIEQRVIGGDWGANGFTTMAQADTLARELHLSAGDRLLDLGSGGAGPGCTWPPDRLPGRPHRPATGRIAGGRRPRRRDALGVPWEGTTPDKVHWEALEALPAQGDWPHGSTSDDTEQLLLVAEYLVEANGQISERDFLGRLAKAMPGMRGAGPTTQAAVRRFLSTGELQATDGSSIGAAMRALPFGWGNPSRRGSAAPRVDHPALADSGLRQSAVMADAGGLTG